MPLYEWRCGLCGGTFEALAAVGVSRRKRRCPRCGRHASRVLSGVAFLSGRAPAPVDAKVKGGRPDVTDLRIPPLARACWMDDRAAARFAAYKHGRGAEYDDTVAARTEARQKYGGKDEGPKSHGHSPLADPAVFARRAAAARKSSKRK